MKYKLLQSFTLSIFLLLNASHPSCSMEDQLIKSTLPELLKKESSITAAQVDRIYNENANDLIKVLETNTTLTSLSLRLFMNDMEKLKGIVEALGNNKTLKSITFEYGPSIDHESADWFINALQRHETLIFVDLGGFMYEKKDVCEKIESALKDNKNLKIILPKKSVDSTWACGINCFTRN